VKLHYVSVAYGTLMCTYVLWEHELLTQNSFEVGRKVMHITLISFFEMYDGILLQ